jgi:hypothetical protein
MFRMRLLIFAAWALGIQPQTPAQKLSIPQQEEFLRTAKATDMRRLNTGVTGAMRVTLVQGDFRHDAQFQPVDIHQDVFETRRGREINFRDTYKFNVAAWQLAKMLGIEDMTPPSIERRLEGLTGAVTWWIDDVAMDEKARLKKKLEPPNPQQWNKEVAVIRVFDQLIENADRNLGNLLIDKQWRPWMIDHTRAFRTDTKLRNPGDLTRCDRALLERMRQLNRADLRATMKHLLGTYEIDGLLARRDEIVRFFDKEVGTKGEAAALFDRPRRD